MHNLSVLRTVWNSNFVVMLRRMAIIYVVYFVLHAAFYIYNRPVLGAIAWSELWTLVEGMLTFDTVSILYANSLLVVLSLVPFRFRERCWWQAVLFWYFIVVNAVCVVVNLADAVFFSYTQKRFTAEEIFYTGNDNTALMLGKFMAENWYLLLVAAALVWGMAWAWRKTGTPRTPIKNGFVYFLSGVVMLALAAVLAIGGIRGGFSRDVRPIAPGHATLYTSSPARAYMILSNPFCILRTIGSDKIIYRKYFTSEELEAIYTPVHRPAERDTLVLGRRNVVIFILESFSAELSSYLNPDLHPDGRGFTPFLDSLMREGFACPEAYANGRRSIFTMPTVLSSIPSMKVPFMLMPQSLSETRSMPRMLADEGYSTSFFCGSGRGSMGFGAYAHAAGVENIYSREDYEAKHGTGGFDNYWGIWDDKFFGYMGEVLTQTPQPFFSSVYSLSSHHPFVVPEQYAASLPEGRTRIDRPAAYTDLALRMFYERFSDEEWFRNTIFVFVADHVSSEKYAPRTNTSRGNKQIILFFHTPDGALKGREESVVQQLDIMPTLLGLLGNTRPYFAFGRDIIGEKGRLPAAFNYDEQVFQIITDSLTLSFDENVVAAAYSRGDTLERNNIAHMATTAMNEAERLLKAFIQQYYTRVEQKDFMPHPSSGAYPPR